MKPLIHSANYKHIMLRQYKLIMLGYYKQIMPSSYNLLMLLHGGSSSSANIGVDVAP